jgi:hypothetical protein
MFPAALAAEAAPILAALERDQLHPPYTPFAVRWGAEQLVIPQRVYYPTALLDTLAGRPQQQQALIGCIFTRHCDGYVRERALRSVIGTEYPWVAPFVVQLAGEYVVEILEVIVANLDQLPRGAYAAFLAANPAFYATTKRRIVSYWDCYYRWKTPRFKEYAGAKIIAHLDQLTALASAPTRRI